MMTLSKAKQKILKYLGIIILSLSISYSHNNNKPKNMINYGIYELIYYIIVCGFLFISFFIIISILGFSVFNIFSISSKSNDDNDESLSIGRILFISFGIGVSIFIAYCYVLEIFNFFNFLSGYFLLILFDIIYITLYLWYKKNSYIKIKEIIRFCFFDEKKIISYCILLLTLIIAFVGYYFIYLRSIGLLSKDPYYYFLEIYYLIKKGKIYREIRDTALYPSGFFYFTAGILLPLEDTKLIYFFIKLGGLYFLFLYIIISYVIIKSFLKENYLIFISLFFILISRWFLYRTILNLASCLASILFLLIIDIIINDNIPTPLLGFFISALYLIHPLSFFLCILAIVPYKILQFLINRRLFKFLDLLYKFCVLLSIFIIILTPYILDVIINNSIAKLFRIPFSQMGNLFYIRYSNEFYLFLLQDWSFLQLDDLLLYIEKELFDNTIGLFLIMSFLCLFLYFFKTKKEIILKNIFFKLNFLIIIGFYFLDFYYPDNFFLSDYFISEYKFRILETYNFSIVILASLSFKWLLNNLENFMKKIDIIHLKFNSTRKIPLIIKTKFKPLIIALIIFNISWLYINRYPIKYSYLYEDDLIEIYLYIREYGKPNSIILRPQLYHGASIDNILYDMKMYEYEKDSDLDSIIESYINESIDFFIFKKIDFDSSEFIEFIDELNGKEDVLKIPSKTSLDDNFSGKVNGTIEWWIYLKPGDSNVIDFIFRNNEENKIFLYLTNRNQGEWKLRLWNIDQTTPLIANISEDKWYHLKVDFECSNGNYSGLGQQKFKILLNENIIFDNGTMWNNEEQNINNFNIDTSSSSGTLEGYINAINYSWDMRIWDEFISIYQYLSDLEILIENEGYILYEV